MFCPKCGFQTDEQFCSSCGADLRKLLSNNSLSADDMQKPAETPKKKGFPIIGLICAVLGIIYTLSIYSRLHSYDTDNGWRALGAMVASRFLSTFMTMCAISSISCFIGTFTKIKWLFLAAAIMLIIGLLQLPAIAGVPDMAIILIVLQVLAFISECVKESKTKK